MKSERGPAGGARAATPARANQTRPLRDAMKNDGRAPREYREAGVQRDFPAFFRLESLESRARITHSRAAGEQRAPGAREEKIRRREQSGVHGRGARARIKKRPALLLVALASPVYESLVFFLRATPPRTRSKSPGGRSEEIAEFLWRIAFRNQSSHLERPGRASRISTSPQLFPVSLTNDSPPLSDGNVA